MEFDVRAVAFGRPAAELLAEEVREAKSGDALAPVTVVVPSHYLGVAMRRELAKTGTGVASVNFTTTRRLAELIGGPRLAAAGRRPVSAPVIAAAIRTELAAGPGVFQPVAQHPATEEALTAAYRELAGVEPTALEALARTSDRAGDVVRVTSAARDALSPGWFDEHDLLDAAADEVRSAHLPIDVGTVIVHLPERVTFAEAAFLRAVADDGHAVHVNVGVTGDDRADATTREHVQRLGAAVSTGHGVSRPVAGSIVSASDPDEEVRAAVRMVVDAARVGTPLGRIAVLYGTTEPYAELLHEHLAAAGIPRNGVAVTRLADSLAGATLRTLLSLPDTNFRRRDVLGLIASAPIRDPSTGTRVPSRAWERLSRQAGIVEGDDWDVRLPLLEDELRMEAAEADEEGRTGLALGKTGDADRAKALIQFFGQLRHDIETANQLGTWAALAAWATAMLTSYLGDLSRRLAWPEEQRRAADRVDAALERVAALDALGGPAPTVEVFRRTFEAELDTALPRVGRLGDGVLVGHVALATGLVLDKVIVLGMAEGAFPSRRLEDSLMPDAEREVTGGALPLRVERVHDDHRRLLAAVAGATEAVLCYPRGDLRRSGDRPASRWLLADASHHAGRTVFTADLPRLRHEPWFTEIPSFAGELARVDFPATRQEYALRALVSHTGRLEDHPLVANDDVLRRGVELVRARSSAAFTRFDGNLSHVAVTSPIAAGRPVSATSLEKWASCPHRYLFEHVLRVAVVDDPERTLEMSALDKGNLVHKILEDFIGEVVDSKLPPPPWVDTHRARLMAIADEHCLAYDAKGLTGRALFWNRDRARILADLELFLQHDNTRMRQRRSAPVDAEMAFDDALVLLPDGRAVRFRGKADRIDQAEDGSLTVIDYKTGGTSQFKGLSEADPHLGGTKLQLAVYGEAARVRYGTPATQVDSLYWFLTTKGEFKVVGYPITPEITASVSDALAVIVGGIESGLFPSRPNPEPTWTFVDCDYCNPDGLGTADRRREWERKSNDPRLARYVALCEPGAGDG